MGRIIGIDLGTTNSLVATVRNRIPVVVGGRHLRTGHLLENRNPADRSEILSRHHLADRKTAERALEVAVKLSDDASGTRWGASTCQPCVVRSAVAIHFLLWCMLQSAWSNLSNI